MKEFYGRRCSKTLKKEDIPKLGKKISQLKKRISRTSVSGKIEKVGFRKMRIKKIKKQIAEILKK
jgi:ribosomal protein L29